MAGAGKGVTAKELEEIKVQLARVDSLKSSIMFFGDATPPDTTGNPDQAGLRDFSIKHPQHQMKADAVAQTRPDINGMFANAIPEMDNQNNLQMNYKPNVAVITIEFDGSKSKEDILKEIKQKQKTHERAFLNFCNKVGMKSPPPVLYVAIGNLGEADDTGITYRFISLEMNKWLKPKNTTECAVINSKSQPTVYSILQDYISVFYKLDAIAKNMPVVTSNNNNSMVGFRGNSANTSNMQQPQNLSDDTDINPIFESNNTPLSFASSYFRNNIGVGKAQLKTQFNGLYQYIWNRGEFPMDAKKHGRQLVDIEYNVNLDMSKVKSKHAGFLFGGSRDEHRELNCRIATVLMRLMVTNNELDQPRTAKEILEAAGIKLGQRSTPGFVALIPDAKKPGHYKEHQINGELVGIIRSIVKQIDAKDVKVMKNDAKKKIIAHRKQP